MCYIETQHLYIGNLMYHEVMTVWQNNNIIIIIIMIIIMIIIIITFIATKKKAWKVKLRKCTWLEVVTAPYCVTTVFSEELGTGIEVVFLTYSVTVVMHLWLLCLYQLYGHAVARTLCFYGKLVEDRIIEYPVQLQLLLMLLLLLLLHRVSKKAPTFGLL